MIFFAFLPFFERRACEFRVKFMRLRLPITTDSLKKLAVLILKLDNCSNKNMFFNPSVKFSSFLHFQIVINCWAFEYLENQRRLYHNLVPI